MLDQGVRRQQRPGGRERGEVTLVTVLREAHHDQRDEQQEQGHHSRGAAMTVVAPSQVANGQHRPGREPDEPGGEQVQRREMLVPRVGGQLVRFDPAHLRQPERQRPGVPRRDPGVPPAADEEHDEETGPSGTGF